MPEKNNVNGYNLVLPNKIIINLFQLTVLTVLTVLSRCPLTTTPPVRLLNTTRKQAVVKDLHVRIYLLFYSVLSLSLPSFYCFQHMLYGYDLHLRY